MSKQSTGRKEKKTKNRKTEQKIKNKKADLSPNILIVTLNIV